MFVRFGTAFSTTRTFGERIEYGPYIVNDRSSSARCDSGWIITAPPIIALSIIWQRMRLLVCTWLKILWPNPRTEWYVPFVPTP